MYIEEETGVIGAMGTPYMRDRTHSSDERTPLGRGVQRVPQTWRTGKRSQTLTGIEYDGEETHHPHTERRDPS